MFVNIYCILDFSVLTMQQKVINGNLVKKNILYERESINQVDFVEDLTVPFCTLLKYIYCVLFSFASTGIFFLKRTYRGAKTITRYFSVNFLMGQKIIFLISHASLNALMILWLQGKNMVLFIFLHNLTFPPKIHVQVINKRFTGIKSSKKAFELHRI